jgi:hypothetical protein
MGKTENHSKVQNHTGEKYCRTALWILDATPIDWFKYLTNFHISIQICTQNWGWITLLFDQFTFTWLRLFIIFYFPHPRDRNLLLLWTNSRTLLFNDFFFVSSSIKKKSILNFNIWHKYVYFLDFDIHNSNQTSPFRKIQICTSTKYLTSFLNYFKRPSTDSLAWTLMFR